MPRIKAQLAEAIEPTEGYTYKITEVEETKTAVQAFNAYRVKLEPTKRKKEDEKEYATMLWLREEAGITSKLGSFMAAFLDYYGDEDIAFETDNWLDCIIRIVKWQPRDRAIEVIEGQKK